MKSNNRTFRPVLEKIFHIILFVVLLYFIVEADSVSPCKQMCRQICDACMIGIINRYTNHTQCIYT